MGNKNSPKIIFGVLIFILFKFLHAEPLKGVSLQTSNSHANALIQATRVNWYYTWGGESIPNTDAEFVPMVWGEKNYRQQSKFNNTKAVLLFNEPDSPGQSNLKPEQAVDALAGGGEKFNGIRVGSPAPAHLGGPWLGRFMALSNQKKIRIDFVAIHWYGGPNAQRFLRQIDAIHAAYKKPIWITEFAVADWDANKRGRNRYSEKQIALFMREAINGLRQRSYVERYAWYSTPHKTNLALSPSQLWDDQGKLTELGRVYSGL